jgi:hypothetical protein
MKEVLGAVRRGDEAKAFVGNALDCASGSRHVEILEELAGIGRPSHTSCRA